jgi:hypothetical protein
MSNINPQPKKLTLDQALSCTKKPLARMGDLIFVDVDIRHNITLERVNAIKNGLPSGYPNFQKGEIRSTFMPTLPDKKKQWQKIFTQPETKNYLRQEYARGCYLESQEHFSNEALALHFGYRGGFHSDGNWAGDVGDPSDFERDCNDILASYSSPSHKDYEAIRKITLNQHRKYKLAANQGRDTSTAQTKKASASRAIKNESLETLDSVIAQLKQNHIGEKPAALWIHLKTAIAEWSDSDCTETRPSETKDSWAYQFSVNGNRKTITFGNFRKKLNKK